MVYPKMIIFSVIFYFMIKNSGKKKCVFYKVESCYTGGKKQNINHLFFSIQCTLPIEEGGGGGGRGGGH